MRERLDVPPALPCRERQVNGEGHGQTSSVCRRARGSGGYGALPNVQRVDCFATRAMP